MSRRPPKMRVVHGPKVPVTVAEWDVTPDLYAWTDVKVVRG